MLDANLQQKFKDFFSLMAQSLAKRDTSALSEQYHIPTVFVNEGEKKICANKQEIEDFLVRLFAHPKVQQTHAFEWTLLQAMKLSDVLFFVQVAWVWKSSDDATLVKRMTSYTLQQNAGGEFDVVVSVADDSALSVDKDG